MLRLEDSDSWPDLVLSRPIRSMSTCMKYVYQDNPVWRQANSGNDKYRVRWLR